MTRRNDSAIEHPIVIIVVILSVIGVWLSGGVVISLWMPDLARRGLMGDAFGTVNSFFTALAFSGIVVSLLLQVRDLRYQRKELALSRTAQQETADALREQHERMKDDLRIGYVLARSRIVVTLAEYQVRFIKQDPMAAELRMKTELERCLEQLDELVAR